MRPAQIIRTFTGVFLVVAVAACGSDGPSAEEACGNFRDVKIQLTLGNDPSDEIQDLIGAAEASGSEEIETASTELLATFADYQETVGSSAFGDATSNPNLGGPFEEMREMDAMFDELAAGEVRSAMDDIGELCDEAGFDTSVE